MRKSILILVILIFLHTCYTRTVEQNIIYNHFKKENHFKYLTKFTSDIGITTYKIRAKFNQPLDYQAQDDETIALSISIVQDTNWGELESAISCKEKRQLSSYHETLEIPINGNNWSKYIVGTILEREQSHIWYYNMQDCDEIILKKDPRGLRVLFEIVMLNEGMNHLSYEEFGLQYIHLGIMLITLLFLVVNLKYLFAKQDKDLGFDWALFYLSLSVFFQFLSSFLEYIHLYILKQDGEGIVVLQIFSAFSQVITQFAMAILLLLLAWGWTISYQVGDDLDVYVIIGVMFGILNIIFVGLSKLTDGMSYKNHQYDGYIGYIISGFKLIMLIIFINGLKSTKQTAKLRAIQFLDKISIQGIVYFLFFPLLFYTSYLVLPQLQNQFVVFCENLFQFQQSVSLFILIGNKSGIYNQICFRRKLQINNNEKFE